MPSQRLPTVSGDNNAWGTILNGYLTVAHASDGGLLVWTDPKNPTYGTVKGDGVNDDTAGLNAALSAGAGGEVRLGPGTYLISNILQIPSGTRFRGAGMGKTTIKAVNGYAPTQVGGLNGANMLVVTNNGGGSDIEVRDMTFDANQANVTSFTAPITEGNSHTVDLRSVTKLRVINIEVINAIRWSIHVLRCTNVLIQGCRVLTGQTTGVRTQQDCIHLTECTQMRVLDNDCDSGTSGDGDDCIAIRSATSGFPATDGVVQGNVLRSGARAIALVSAGDNVKDITIGPNEVRGTRADGIIFNWITGSGIFQNISITGVVMHDICSNNGHGVNLQNNTGSDGYNNVRISGLVIRSFLNTGGILIFAGQGQRLTIEGVVATNVLGTRGINVGDSGKPVKYFTVSNCNLDMTASGAASPAYLISRCINGTVTGNVGLGVTGGGSYGIQLTGDGTNGCTDVTVTGNRMASFANGIAEVNSGANPDFNTIVGNNVRGSTTGITTLGTNTLTSTNRT